MYFKNLGNSNESYYTEGLSDELINRLTKVNNLRVLPSFETKKFDSDNLNLDSIYYHLETEYMHKLLKDKVAKHSNFTDECIELIVSSLKTQELKVITNRYGLVDGIFRTQKEVGTFLGISRQRVSQIESKAIKKIRISKSLENLFEIN